MNELSDGGSYRHPCLLSSDLTLQRIYKQMCRINSIAICHVDFASICLQDCSHGSPASWKCFACWCWRNRQTESYKVRQIFEITIHVHPAIFRHPNLV